MAIDLRVQGVLEERAAPRPPPTFNADAAVGVVTNVRTGEILALSSQPDFDPNQPGRLRDRPP